MRERSARSSNVTDDALANWKYLKGAKKEPRYHRNGDLYHYAGRRHPVP